MKKIFILALLQVMAPFTIIAMNPPFQEQNSQASSIIPHLENTGPMPALNNNPINTAYLLNDTNQIIELVQLQTHQNQAKYNLAQNQKYMTLEKTDINQHQSKKRSAHYRRQNKRRRMNPLINKLEKLKSIELNSDFLRIFFKDIYKNTFKNNKSFKIEDELLQKFISNNNIKAIKQNIDKLFWAANCPISNCPHTAHASISSRYLYSNLKTHITTKHTNDFNAKEITSAISKLKIKLVLDKNEYQPTILIQDLEAHDNNIKSIKTHLEKRYQNKFKNGQLSEIKDELLQKIISDYGIEQTKQNMEELYWTINCPINNCQHTVHTSINNKYLHGNLKQHINVKHAGNPDLQKIINEIKQLRINLVLNRKRNQPITLTQNLEAHNNINAPTLKCKDQNPTYNNYSQLAITNFYSDNFNPIELGSFFDNQNEILASNDFQDPIFDLFNINQ